MALFRQTGYDARGTLLTVARAGDMIQRLVAGEGKAEIIRELATFGAEKRFEVKIAEEDTGLGFQIIYDKCVAEAERANSGIRTHRPVDIRLFPAHKKFPKWLRQHGHAKKIDGKTGVVINAPSEEYAKRFREVLTYYGIESELENV